MNQTQHNQPNEKSNDKEREISKNDMSKEKSDIKTAAETGTNLSTNESQSKKNYLSLYKRTNFNDENEDDKINEIKKKVLIKKDEPVKMISLNEDDLKKRNFILTKNAKERLSKLYNYIRLGIPVLLEGPTGTSKTLSVEIICSILEEEEKLKPVDERKKRTLKRFNLSQETKTQDLLGTYIGDQNSFAGIKSVDGPFIEAFRDGYPLLLDEINLASKEVLQCIEESLDSKILSIEISGKPLQEIKAHPDFTLIATQNPNKGLFSGKRQDLGLKFLSRFQVIEFPELFDELNEIAEGLGKRFGYLSDEEKSPENEKKKKIIEDIVSFHKEWSKNKIIEDDVQMFTVREIAAVMKALSVGMDPFETMLIIYGARYTKDKKEKMLSVLKSRDSFKNSEYPKVDIPKNFPRCYHNKYLSETISSILFSFKNGRHVIISGHAGCGKTKVARWIAKYYEKTQKIYNKNENYFCICTEEIKPSDLIGKQKPSDKETIKKGGEILCWKNGFLTDAIIKGRVAILDCIEQAPTTVTERLNGLLDKKYDGKKKYFEVPENPNYKQGVLMDDRFRLLCTCNIEKINSMSPAFVNRFDVIVLEDQLDGLNDQELKNLITILFEQSVEKKINGGNNNFENNDTIKTEFDDYFSNINNNEQRLAQGNNLENNNGASEHLLDEFGNEINEQASQKDEFGNIISDQASQKDEFGNIISDQASQKDEFGNIINDQASQKDEFGNIINDPTSQKDEFGNIINDPTPQKDEFGNEITSESLKKELRNSIDGKDIKNIIEDENFENDEDEPDEKYVPSDELVSIIIEKYKVINEENKKRNQSPFSIYSLFQLCRATRIFEMKKIENVSNEMLVNFCIIMILNNELDNNNLIIPEPIKKFLLDLPDEPESDDSKFFYKDSESLKNFMAIVHAASMINIPLCIWGAPGAGKTAMIRAFGRIRAEMLGRYSKYSPSFQMHTFHNGTKANDFFGTTTIKEGGEITFSNGTLTTAMKDGYIFIADEMNVSPIQTMKSLAPALEPAFGECIYIPGVEQNIYINNSFTFIACQNFIGTVGRNAIPDSIVNRFRQLNYPIQEEKDVQKICSEIKNSFYPKGMRPKFKDREAALCGSFMLKFNELEQRLVPKWSLRDITKIFKRMVNQEENFSNFLNINILHNIMFYVLSSVNQSELKKKSFENGKTFMDKILELIKITFMDDMNLSEEDIEDLRKCFLDIPIIKNKQDENGTNQYYLMKNKIGISINFLNNLFKSDNNNNSNNTTDLETLPSLSNDLFKVLLSDKEEPILLTGPTGYKTFLSQQFLKDTIPVTVNQESTVEQLLGTSAFLSKTESKLFYLKNICNICDSGEYEELSKKIVNENCEISEKEIDEIFEGKYEFSPFTYALDNLKKKLLKKDKEIENKNALSDMILEFRPGLFLTAILSKKKLILKNLSNLPTTVLERFNELFSGKHNLTVNEDIHNTFTPPHDKELRNFSKYFRVFATCPSGLASKLSEAVLSRFTVIYVETYNENEQKSVLDSYCKTKKLDIRIEEINKVIDFVATYKQKNKLISLNQMINILFIASQLNKKIPENRAFNLSLILYRVSNGLNTTRENEKYLINLIFDNIKINTNIQMETPLIESKDKNGNKGILSKVTNLLINTNQSISQMKLAFTKNMIDMIDILHLGIYAKIPVIFEGETGQGKQTAIKYVADSLGLEIVNIILSQSTNTEDLLGRVKISKNEDNEIKVETIKTKLRQNLEASSNSGKSIIVFHNLNNATAAVLELITNIFDYKQEAILLPDGSKINKGPINIVGLFDPQNGMNNRDKLPLNLRQSSIYHILKYTNEKDRVRDLYSVIRVKFEDSSYEDDNGNIQNFSSDIEIFAKRFIDTYNFLVEQNEKVLTYNDVSKYIILRKATKNKLDEKIISQFIFAYCLSEQEKIEKILKILNLDQAKFNPTFTYNNIKQEIYIRLAREGKEFLTLPIYKKFSQDEINIINKNLDSLTKPQKQCILNLSSALLAKRTCIVQGGTASGKSLIIRIFSQMMGKKLNIYQMNSETGVSIIQGQPQIMEELDEKEIKILTEMFDDINKILDKELIESGNIRDMKRKDFENIIKLVDNELNSKKIPKENLKKLKKYQNLINKIISPASRFKTQKSTFIKAMETGEWILIDGIESAPPQIPEKISSLCGDNPELDLIECGPEFCYSMIEKEGYKKIHQDFRIFITYNPNSSKNANIIEQTLLTKCISFGLPPIDSKIEYSSQIFYSSLKNAGYNKTLSENLAPRLAGVHNLVLKDSIENTDKYCGEVHLTGRKIIFVCKEFFDSSNSLEEQIVDGIRTFYYLGYNDINELPNLKEKVVNEFRKNVENFKSNELNIEDLHKPLLIMLRDIQLFCINNMYRNKENEFEFSQFIEYCLNIRMDSLEEINWHIKDTIKIVETYKTINQFEKAKFKQIIIIEKILDSLIENKKFLKTQDMELPIKDPILLKTKELVNPILKLKLLSKLVTKEELFFTRNLNLDLITILKESIDTIYDKIMLLYTNQNLNTFKNFIEEMNKIDENKNYYNMKFVKVLFPNPIFNSSNFYLVNFWIDLLVKLNDQKNTFIINFGNTNNNNIKFGNQNNPKSLNIKLIFENDDLLLSPGSFIYCSSSKMKFEIKQKNKNDTFLLYRLIIEFYKKENVSINMVKNKVIELKKKYEVSIPCNSEYFNISNYFLSNNEHTIIGMAWSLIYNLELEYVEKIKNLSYISHKDIFNLNIKLYEGLISDEMIQTIIIITKSFSSFCKTTSILWQIITNNLIYNIDDESKINTILEDIKREIISIERLKINKDEIFSKQKYIDMLNNVKDDIAIKKTGNEKDKKLQRLKIDFEKLITNLKKKEFNDDISNNLKRGLVDNLTSLQSQDNFELNEEIFKNYENIINDFISSENNKKIKTDQKDMLNWSVPNLEDYSGTKSETIKLLEDIIWYSKYYNILEEIKPDTPKETLKNLVKEILSENDEMNVIGNYLWENILLSQDSGFSSKVYTIIYSSLNAFLIKRLSNHDLLKYLSVLDEQINKLEKRSDINNELYSWANKYAKNINMEFKLYLPKFEYTDLLFTYINFNVNNKYTKGPELNNIETFNSNLAELAPLLNIPYKSHEECMNNVAGTIYKNLFDPRAKSIEIDHEKLKQLFKDKQDELNKLKITINDEKKKEINRENSTLNEKLRTYEQNELLCNRVLQSLEISEVLDVIKNYNLKYPEIKENQNKINFNDWLDDDEFIENYPTVIFWCYRFNNYFNQFPIFKGNETEIPFWFFIFRILSSLKCVVMEDKNNYSQIINKKVSKLLTEKLSGRNYQNLGKSWLNLLINNLPFDVKNESLSLIYNFICKLGNDKKSLESPINDIKMNIIEKLLESIYEKLFENKLSEALETNNEINKFFNNPNIYVYNEILKELNKKFKEVQHENPALDFYDNVKDILPEKKKDLIDKAKEKNNELLNEFRTQKKKDKDDELKKNIKTYIENIEGYINDCNKFESKEQTILNNVESGEDDNKIKNYLENLQNINNINDKEKYKNIFEEFMQIVKKNKTINEYIFNLKNFPDEKKILEELYDNTNTYGITIKKIRIKIKNYYILLIYNHKCIILLNESEIELYMPDKIEIDVYDLQFKKCDPNVIQTEYIKIKSIKDIYIENNYEKAKENYKNIFLKNYRINDKDAKKILFGDKNLNVNDFEKELNQMENLIKNLEDIFVKFDKYNINQNIKKDELKNFYNDFFNKINDYKSKESKFIQQLTSKISRDDQRKPEIEEDLNDIKISFESFNNNLNTFYNKVEDIIKPLWEQIIDLPSEDDTFTINYSCPNIIINQTNELKQFNFSGLNVNSDYLSLPTITIENDTLKCCYKELNYSFGSICPSLFKNNAITLNILSFINKNIKYSIEIINSNIIYINEQTDNENNEQSKDIIETKSFLNFQMLDNILKLFIQIPQLKDESKIQKIKMECDINFIGKSSIKNNIIHCIFTANLIPLSVFISCDKYDLAYDKDKDYYIISTHRLNPKEIVNFNVKYFNIDLEPKFKINLESYPPEIKDGETDNEADKPILSIDLKNNKFSLEMPDYRENEKIKRLKCIITIYFTEKLYIRIIIDANIVPFDFNLACFDFATKKWIYDNDNEKPIILLNKHILPIEYTLHLKICIPIISNNKNNFICKSENNNVSKYIEFKDKSKINTEFDFVEEIDIPILIKENIIDNGGNVNVNCRSLNYILSINNIKKKMQINFGNLKKEEIQKYNLDKYTLNDGQIVIHKQNENIKKYDELKQDIDLFHLYSSETFDNYKTNVTSLYFKYNGEKTDKDQYKDSRWYELFGLFSDYWYSIPFIKKLKYQYNSKDCEFWYPFNQIINENTKKFFSSKNINENKNNFFNEIEIKGKNEISEANNKKSKSNKKFSFFSIAYLIKNSEKFEQTIREFLDIKENKQNKKEQEERKYQLIIKLFDKFNDRIKFIKDNLIQTTEDYISKEEISKIQNKIKADFYNNSIVKNYEFKSSSNILDLTEKIKESETVKFLEIPELTSEAYVITEDSRNISKKRGEKQDFQISKPEEPKAEAIDIEVELPDFELDPNNLNFNSFIELLNNGIQVTRILPIYIKNVMKAKEINKSKNEENEKIAKDKFELLVNLYNSIKLSKNSIISNVINDYIDSFLSMATKLHYSGVRIKNIIKNLNLENNYKLDFIKFPEINIEVNKYTEKLWEQKKDNIIEDEQIKQEKFKELYSNLIDNKTSYFKAGKILERKGKEIDKDNNSFTNRYSDENDINNDTINNSSKNIPSVTNETNTENNIAKEPVKGVTMDKNKLENAILSSLLQNVPEKQMVQEEEDFNSDEEQRSDEDNKTDSVMQNSNAAAIKSEIIAREDFASMIEGYSEKDAVEKFCNTILNYENLEKEGKKLPELKLGSIFKAEEPQYLDAENNGSQGYFVQSLYDISINLSSRIYANSTNLNTPYMNICVNILLDCTFFIDNGNKFYIMFLVCALTNAINSMEIPYSITLISDENFKATIKKYDEPHSLKVIQRVFDCIFITRFYTSLPNSLKFAVNNLHFRPQEERPYRAFFIFSNGLDDQLYLSNEWKEKIFKSSSTHLNDKYGFTFIKGNELSGDNLEIVKRVWNNFENVNKDKVRITKIISDNPITDYEHIVEDFSKMVCDTLDFPNAEIKNINKIEKKFEPIFELKNLVLDNISPFKGCISDIHYDKGIFANKTDILAKAIPLSLPLDSQYYRNKLNKITSVKINQNIIREFNEFITKFPENKNKLSPSSIESLFKPNYASQKVLSTQGSEFDITALILNLINPVPNPRIYLEKKIMDKRKYGITIVIDSSYSCFNTFNFNHSVLTIRALFSSLLVHELPSLDVIVAGTKEPYILCSNITTTRALGNKSTIYESLFSILQRPPFKVDLSSAIRAAYDLKRLRQEDFPSYLFILTDGLFQKSEVNNIVNMVNCCTQVGMNTFGIGLGIYPKLIENLFPQIIYCKPNDIVKGIAYFLGDNISRVENDIMPQEVNQYNPNEFNSIQSNLIRKLDSPIFEDLKKELENLPIGIDAMYFIYNQDQVGQVGKGYRNPVGKNTEMLKKGTLGGHKILLVMLWTCDMSSKENIRVDPMFITERPADDEKCLKDALDHFGVDVKVVLNYREAIEELTHIGKIKKSEKSDGQYEECCDYYAVWIMCGPPYEVLPDQKNKEDPKLIGKFIDCLIQFWKNQGSIVFLAEGTPLCFQVNVFLENCEFPGYGKLNFRIGGDFKGEKIIKGDESGELTSNGSFNRLLKFSSLTDSDQPPIQRSSISHNLTEMYEGSTISYAIDKNSLDYNNKSPPYIRNFEEIKPFKVFAKGSDGGIISLFYNDDQNKYGDIVIDTGFTKCFLNMKTEYDSYRYFQNIIGWTARPEIHMILDRKSVKFWRPKPIMLDNTTKSKYSFLPKPEKSSKKKVYIVPKMPTIIAIDCSGSISSIKDYYFPTVDEIVEKYKDGPTRYYIWGSSFENKSYSGIKTWISERKGGGGTYNRNIYKSIIESGSSYWNGHLIIITDGEVDIEDIDECDNLMKDSKCQFKYVTTYVIGTGGKWNLSVGAPFNRECANQTIQVLYKGHRDVKMQISNSAINAKKKLDSISTYSEFREYYGKLSNVIFAKMAGKQADDDLKNKLKELKNRVINDPLLKRKQVFKEKFEELWKKLYDMADGKVRDKLSFDDISAFQNDNDDDE